jgi:hypothetical protein
MHNNSTLWDQPDQFRPVSLPISFTLHWLPICSARVSALVFAHFNSATSHHWSTMGKVMLGKLQNTLHPLPREPRHCDVGRLHFGHPVLHSNATFAAEWPAAENFKAGKILQERSPRSSSLPFTFPFSIVFFFLLGLLCLFFFEHSRRSLLQGRCMFNAWGVEFRNGSWRPTPNIQPSRLLKRPVQPQRTPAPTWPATYPQTATPSACPTPPMRRFAACASSPVLQSLSMHCCAAICHTSPSHMSVCHTSACHMSVCHMSACHMSVCHTSACHMPVCHMSVCHMSVCPHQHATHQHAPPSVCHT